MMNKKNLPHIITVVSFVVFIVLGLACASTPTTQIELSAHYRGMLQAPSGNERAIDSVGVRGSRSFVCSDHTITTTERLGATYQLGGKTTTKKKAAQATAPAAEKHRHEPILDQLLAEAKRHYPSEKIDIRNAKTARHIPTNARIVQTSSGGYYTEYDCFLYYTADVITTEPMPRPVTHSENFTKPGATRNDIYRVARNWIDDNTQRRRITVQSENMSRGRIVGTVTSSARADQTYIVTSSFTIDVYDARVELRFEDTFLRRTDPSQELVGDPEPIFLQSIADATLKELVEFSTTLRSSILAR